MSLQKCCLIKTIELTPLADWFIVYNAFPSVKGYNGFRDSICPSVNNELVHGIPGKRVWQEGCISNDIITCFHGDSAWTYPVGKIDDETQRLLQVTEESLYRWLEEAIKTRLSNISHAIQTYVEAERFSVVREYVGHGIGQDLHEDLFLISVHLIKVLG